MAVRGSNGQGAARAHDLPRVGPGQRLAYPTSPPTAEGASSDAPSPQAYTQNKKRDTGAGQVDTRPSRGPGGGYAPPPGRPVPREPPVDFPAPPAGPRRAARVPRPVPRTGTSKASGTYQLSPPVSRTGTPRYAPSPRVGAASQGHPREGQKDRTTQTHQTRKTPTGANNNQKNPPPVGPWCPYTDDPRRESRHRRGPNGPTEPPKIAFPPQSLTPTGADALLFNGPCRAGSCPQMGTSRASTRAQAYMPAGQNGIPPREQG